MSVTPEAVLDALKVVQDPDLGRDIVSLGFVKDVVIDGGAVSFKVELTTPACPVKEDLKRQSHAAVAALPGVTSVEVAMTAQVRGQAAPVSADAPAGLAEVKNIIAVGAGKGGVGKSTVAVNLALALLESGATVGLMDGDVYGPSIPKMLGSSGAPTGSGPNQIDPNEAYGLKLMSMGYLLDADKPMIVRGPIVHTVVRQFLSDVQWGALDYLVVDLPPGTGDVALSLAQSAPLTGAVVVSTPQDVSLLDVHKAVSMFRQLKVPVLGLVENMSWYECPACSNRDEVFGHGGAEAWASTQSIPFLGGVPLHASVAVGGDEGRPALSDDRTPDHVRSAFRVVAGELARQVSIANMAAPAQPLIQIKGL
jgi:ATP-binding protein involved in chromosome partitioning